MSEFDEIIEDSHKKQVRNIMMSFKTTSVGKHLNDRFNQFIWTLIVFAFTVGTAWMSVIGDIKTNRVFGQETRTQLVTHIGETKGGPLSELQIQNKVENIEDDVADHNEKINKHEDSIIVLDRDMAVQKVQYDNIMSKLEELIKKGE